MKYEDVLRKVKGLLATANENVNEQEAQTAFALAQKLMVKHNISASDITYEKDSVEDQRITEHKTLHWYEKIVANMIAKNFRVKSYLEAKRVNGRTQKAVKFFGLKEDVQLATEMYKLASDVLDFYTKLYVDMYWGHRKRNSRITSQVKNSYMRGFITALEEVMNTQREELENEYGLIVITPVVVEEAFNEKQKSFTKARRFNVPFATAGTAYANGYNDGKNVDLQRKSIK